jgi:hypothetical protein
MSGQAGIGGAALMFGRWAVVAGLTLIGLVVAVAVLAVRLFF